MAAKGKIRITGAQAMALLVPYVRKRVLEQVKAVWLIILYLILFQTIILGIPVADAAVIAVGIGLVVVGLTFFMEGLLLGLMPLGEVVGVKLPQKSSLPVILAFSLLLGFLATLAEPAIQVLQTAGGAVRPWDAPLLFVLLNKQASVLVYSVGAGVGMAVAFGMLRFLYNWSLKPFIYLLVGGLLGVTVYAFFDPNLEKITGLAWDCGAVTTGPVTVPLVLALGIGISRMTGTADSGSAGFGVVTLASLFPIITVFGLGLYMLGSVPKPSSQDIFFAPANRASVLPLFENETDLTRFVMQKTGAQAQVAFFGGEEALLAFLKGVATDSTRRAAIFGSEPDAFERWVLSKGSEAQRLAVFGTKEALAAAAEKFGQAPPAKKIEVREMLFRNLRAAVQAIALLAIPMLFALFVLLRERLPQADEAILGLSLAIIGMMIFSIGIELGLDKLGTQVGSNLPSSFKEIRMDQNRVTIQDFDEAIVQRSIDPDGKVSRFFFSKRNGDLATLPYDASNFDPVTRSYSYVPSRGPLFGRVGGIAGILVVLLFAFIMGYGATLAEPALNALGLTVEEITVGTFKKNLLMQAVAIGVGFGIAIGVGKIIWNIPLAWLLVPPYLLLLVISKLSTEEFVNIGWDSAGVTTGPITVPLVLAMGLGIGTEVGVVEGFGILAMASVCPILSVLLVGMNVTRKRNALLIEAERQEKEKSRAVAS